MHLNIIHNVAEYPPDRYIALFVPETLNTASEGDICLHTFGGDFNFKPAAAGNLCRLKGSSSSSRASCYANSVATRQICLIGL